MTQARADLLPQPNICYLLCGTDVWIRPENPYYPDPASPMTLALEKSDSGQSYHRPGTPISYLGHLQHRILIQTRANLPPNPTFHKPMVHRILTTRPQPIFALEPTFTMPTCCHCHFGHSLGLLQGTCDVWTLKEVVSGWYISKTYQA